MLGMGITTVVATVGQLCKWKDDVSMSESSSLHVNVSLSKMLDSKLLLIHRIMSCINVCECGKMPCGVKALHVVNMTRKVLCKINTVY